MMKKAAENAVKTSEMFFEKRTNPFKDGFSLFRKGTAKFLKLKHLKYLMQFF